MSIEKTIDSIFSYTVPGYSLWKWYRARNTDEPIRFSNAVESDATKAVVSGVLIAIAYYKLKDNYSMLRDYVF